ncbi:TPA: GNAT family N-acetyltransferase [Kluyvera ascorbata]|nr:GNAT family N-acetyltransferase [Kluyvera ascorbata]
MLSIRQATAEDIPLLSHMGYTSYTHHFAHLWKNTDELRQFLEQEYGKTALHQSMAEADSNWLIASTSTPVGFAKYSPGQYTESDGLCGTLLHKLYLMPGETGQRFGEQLFAEVIRQAKAQHETLLWLEVLADNPQARKFYERQGMQHLKDVHFTTATQTSTLHILTKML